MMCKYFKFLVKDKGYTFQLGPVYSFEIRFLKDMDNWTTTNIDGETFFISSGILVCKDGFFIFNDKVSPEENESIGQSPYGWQEHTTKHADDWKLFHIEAYNFIINFQSISNSLLAEIFAKQLLQHSINFDYIRDIDPDLFEHEAIVEAMITLHKQGREKILKKHSPPIDATNNIERNIAELVFHAKILQQQGLTQRDATAKTITKYRKIKGFKIPSKWHNPEASLRQHLKSRLGKTPLFNNIGIQTPNGSGIKTINLISRRIKLGQLKTQSVPR